MNDWYLRRIHWLLTGVVMISVVAALAINAFFSHRAFEQALVPEMAKKAITVGTSIRALMLKAVEQRIDFRRLNGVDQTFEAAALDNPDFSYMAATDARGQILYSRGTAPPAVEAHFLAATTLALLSAPDTVAEPAHVGAHYIVSLPIVAGDQSLGILHIGIHVGFIENLVLEMLFDVVVILVVALFFTLELLNFVGGTRLDVGLHAIAAMLDRARTGNFTMLPSPSHDQSFSGVYRGLEAIIARVNAAYSAVARELDLARQAAPRSRESALQSAEDDLRALRTRHGLGSSNGDEEAKATHLALIRAPFFAFILAEELTRSFLPTYINGLLVPIPGLSTEIVVGLPIVLFMLIVALGQPYFGAYSARLGHRRAMMIGAGIAAVGFAASAMASTVLDLLLWRSLCAVGYGMVFVAAQGFVLRHSTPDTRTRGFALFIGAIMVATVCGPSIGGILADNIGGRFAFAISFLLAIGSIFAIRNLPIDSRDDTSSASINGPRMRDIVMLMLNRRFMTLTGLAAIPAKIVLTGICFYLVPLYVISIGSTQSMAGRLLMTYAVVMVIMVPVAASFAKSRERREWMVAAGLLMSAVGGLLMIGSTSVLWVFAAMLFVGLGQSLAITAQSTLVSEHCHAEIANLGEPVVYGVYRLLERLGNAVGPLIAGLLVMGLGYERSFAAIGALAMICAVAFYISTRTARVPVHATAG
jgi:predicted MFS family arabinose efflux permease